MQLHTPVFVEPVHRYCETAHGGAHAKPMKDNKYKDNGAIAAPYPATSTTGATSSPSPPPPPLNARLLCGSAGGSDGNGGVDGVVGVAAANDVRLNAARAATAVRVSLHCTA
jgi:hypothetical protein